MKRFRKRPILRSPGKIKHWLYRHGYRPKPGSVLFSPSLALIYGWTDAAHTQAWMRGPTDLPGSEDVTDEMREQWRKDTPGLDVWRCTCDAIEYGAMAQHLPPCPLSSG